MQRIIIDEPYQFIPPHKGSWWPRIIQRLDLYSIWLRRLHGVVAYECRHAELLRQSLAAGHGILITPNHCRPSDPIAMGYLAREAKCLLYSMASWHLFKQDWFTAWAIRRMGAFSVYREGVDRTAINMAVDILRAADRPLVIFPEGSVTRTNDRLHALLDGVAFIARTSARRRARDVAGGKVVIHPVALKYLFQGDDLTQVVDPVLSDIEDRFTWRPQRDLPLLERILRIGGALLCLKEMEYFGRPQEGDWHQRLTGLSDRLLQPLEQEWLEQEQEGPVVPRVKAVRMQILPAMVRGELSPRESERRWRQLADLYLAQQVSCYLPDYLGDRPSVERLYETVERFEEDLTDATRLRGPLKVVLQVGPAIEVPPQRDRRAEQDPLMMELEQRLQAMLDELAQESRVYEK